MAAVNVYLLDELKERLKASRLNLSAIAQEGWRRELDRVDARHDKPKGNRER